MAAMIPACADCGQVHIQIRLAGLSRDAELRIALACDLLVTSNIQVGLRRWSGAPRDLLIVDLSDPRGRYAHEMTLHKPRRVLIYGEASGIIGTLAPHMPVAAIERAMRGALLANALSKPVIADSSLLSICLRTTAANLRIRRGPFSVVLCRGAGRIMARMHSDLQAAQVHVTHGGWQPGTVSDDELMDGTWSISKSLDGFLIAACRDQEVCLPGLADTYQLQGWPDLGALKSHRETLRFSLLLRSASWSVDTLAARCHATRERTNAFFWAMLASGTLVRVRSTQFPEASLSEASEPLPGSATPSMFRRLARRFRLTM
ncbi:MAG TPA: hypothetical protein VMV33_14315 [Rhodocyclaceae bacterium]|nr:hypothetical protein [Rhodocyclaceae bacterium]